MLDCEGAAETEGPLEVDGDDDGIVDSEGLTLTLGSFEGAAETEGPFEIDGDDDGIADTEGLTLTLCSFEGAAETEGPLEIDGDDDNGISTARFILSVQHLARVPGNGQLETSSGLQ